MWNIVFMLCKKQECTIICIVYSISIEGRVMCQIVGRDRGQIDIIQLIYN